MDLMESAEVCFGKLHYASAASPHVSKIRLASSQAPPASRLFKLLACGLVPDRPRTESFSCIGIFAYRMPLSHFATLRLLLPVAAFHCPLLPEAAILHAAHPIAYSLCFVIGIR